jgi:hypothetical protein
MRNLNSVRAEKGASAVEFAIVLPFLLVLIFGMIEFSVLLYDKAVITNASREGARVGIVFSDPRVDDTVVTQAVTDYCQGHLITFKPGSGLGIDINPSWPARAGTSAGDDLRVQVTYEYDFLVLPAFIAPFADGINLSAETVMRME